jgi:hypothetical protein
MQKLTYMPNGAEHPRLHSIGSHRHGGGGGKRFGSHR